MLFQTGDVKFLSTSRTTLNEFFVIDSALLSSCQTGRINVKVHYPSSQKKAGLMERYLHLTDSSTAYKLRSAHEFVIKDYKILNLSVMLLVLLFTYLIQIVSLDKSSELRLVMSLFLTFGAIAQSCITEIFLPFEVVSIANRWIAMISYCSYLAFASDYLALNHKKRQLRLHYLLAFASIYIVLQDRIVAWIVFSFFAGAAIGLESLKLRDTRLAILSTLTILTSFEFLGYHGFPNSYIVPSYLAGVIFLENNKAFSSFLKIIRLLKLNSHQRIRKADSSDFKYSSQSVVKLFQKQFKVDRITILSVIDREIIHLQRFYPGRYSAESIQIQELPPVFAHVVTTGNALINVHAESKLVEDIRRRDSKLAIDADYFTVLPLYSGREVVGAIALTKYSPDQFKTPLSHSTFMFCLDMLKSLLVEHMLTAPKTASLEKITLINKKIADADESGWSSTDDIIHSYGKIINSSFGWRVACFGQPDSTFQLPHLGCFSFDPEVEERFINGKIYAHRDNQQGPLAIAVHAKKVVIVPNTKWLEGVVHELTRKFFSIHKTTTAAFVPVFDEDESTVIGVYWIEGVKNNEISYADREMFSSLTKHLSEKIKLIKSKRQLRVSHESLSKFIPEHLVGAFLNGENVVERDHGFLMMFDLKGSTRLSHALGNANFLSEIDVFKDLVISRLNHEWVLRQFVWDGFEFTKTSDPEGSEMVDVCYWEQKLSEIFHSWKDGLVKKYGNLQEISSLAYRVCFTFGDVSRGVVEEGSTRKWALIGNAIAVATKVEQASKALEGTIFCDPSVLKRSTTEWVHLKTTSQGIEVYGVLLSHKTRRAA